MKLLLPALVDATEADLVATAKLARASAEHIESDASPSRWKEADCYAELSKRGWGVRLIAAKCETNRETVRLFILVVTHYCVTSQRPSFWHAFAEVRGDTTAERLVQSNENEWYTPSTYVEAARYVLGGIDLDPASTSKANETIKAERFYTKTQDGLSQAWSGRVWLNPPYGGMTAKFIEKFVSGFRARQITAGICLVNAHCTDTEWFQSLWIGTLCFTNHRIDFTSEKEKHSTSTHGSVFAYLGPIAGRFACAFERFGVIVQRFQERP